jgi:hypothetical protein
MLKHGALALVLHSLKKKFTHKLYASKKVCDKDLPYKGQNQARVKMLNWGENWFLQQILCIK